MEDLLLGMLSPDMRSTFCEYHIAQDTTAIEDGKRATSTDRYSGTQILAGLSLDAFETWYSLLYECILVKLYLL